MINKVFKYLMMYGMVYTALTIMSEYQLLSQAKVIYYFGLLIGFTILLIYFSNKVSDDDIEEAKKWIRGEYDYKFPKTVSGDIDLLIQKQKASMVLDNSLLYEMKITLIQFYKLRDLREEEILDLTLLKQQKITREEYIKKLEVRSKKLNEIMGE